MTAGPMSGRTALIYHEAYDGRGFAPMSYAWRRYRRTLELVKELGLFDGGLQLLRQEPASDEELTLAHSPEYLSFVRRMDALGHGFLDYGDTPVYPGIFKRAAISVGGTLLGVRLIARGELQHAFNPGGGLHHARRDRAGGFCVFNDIVIAVRALQREFGLQRIAIVDLDGHHGDGTQALLYDEPILKLSFHQYDRRFYPGTGALDELGVGEGHGFTVNVPLPRRTGDRAYLEAFEALVPPLLHAYRPEFILLQFGVDGHRDDPLVSLSLTTRGYAVLARRMHELAHELCAGRLMVLGGGGYDPDNVARCWTTMLVEVCGALPKGSHARYEALQDRALAPEGDHVLEQVRQITAQVQRQVFPLLGIRSQPSQV